MRKSEILKVTLLMATISLFWLSFSNGFSMINISNSYSTNDLVSNNSQTNKLVVTSFKDFEIYNNSTNIHSENKNNAISFSYNGSANYGPIIENYILRWDTWGNCTDFEFCGSFTYNFTDIDDMLSFRMITGSYYTYSGEYIGLQPRPRNEDFLSSIGITDPWAEVIGYHVMYIYPFDVKVIHHDDYGSIGYSGNLQVKAMRINNILTCQLIDLESETLIFNETYSDGVNKPINYLFLDFYTGNNYSTVSVNAYEINATLYFKSENTALINIHLTDSIAIFTITVYVIILTRGCKRLVKKR
ncbi:MAG: hypothetical protein K9W42_09050 [Candidatus Heimdallarchaeota archaeon]|nr:hypothetical protein [Candidatus Heimdallarchaeota archaeon]